MPQRRQMVAFAILPGSLCCAIVWAACSAALADRPTPAAIRSSVEKTLAGDPGYRPGDLITGRDVSAVLRDLKMAGWGLAPSEELEKRVVAEGDFLARALGTPKGVAFMRRVATIPQGYDRLDRLSRISGGQQIIERLIDGPDGHKLIAYLAESRGGKNLGGMLGRAAEEEEFNRPTGRIYTAEQLIKELEKPTARGN